MKRLSFKPFFLFIGLSVALVSCGGESTDGEGVEGEAESVMTTQDFIAEAGEMTEEEFDQKYPEGSEITLEGEVRAPATWDDKIVAKFGTGLNDLPLSADFMFEANGGSKESTKEKVKGGEVVRFTGTVGGSFFMDGKFKRCSFSNCVAQ